MDYDKGMHPGAVWKRTDFQIHTPRDAQWSGSPHLAGGSSELEEKRREWANGFVDACVDKGLHAIAVTDHHDFCFIDYVKEAVKKKASESDIDLWFFPGVEVTCDDSVQCLILFDADSENDVFDRLFGGHLQKIEKTSNDAAQAPQTSLSGKDIDELFESVSKDQALAGRAIILPHGSDGDGHKGIIRTGFHVRFQRLPFDGVYIEKPFQELSNKTLRRIRGEADGWGQRRRGIIATGDNRSQGFEKLAVNECWIRLGEPTAEALRQAVLADKARICFERPELPLHRILAVHVNSSLTGENFSLSFNDGFTALIGGRGSGKSSLLQYLQFALGRTSKDLAVGESARNETLIANTLRDGAISVVLERDGVEETWTRFGNEAERIFVEVDDETFPISAQEAQRRFQARGFHQKQLSSLVEDSRTASEQITNIAAAEFIDRQRELDHEILASKRKLSSAFQEIVEYWAAENELRQHRKSLEDLNRRIEAVKEKLRQAGLQEADQKLLEDAPLFNKATDFFEEVSTSINNDLEFLEREVADLPSLDPEYWHGISEKFPDVQSVIEKRNEAHGKIKEAIGQIAGVLQDFQNAQHESSVSFQQKRAQFDAEHDRAMQQQVHTKSITDELAQLEQQKTQVAANERKWSEKLSSLEEAPIALAQAQGELWQKVGEVHELMESAASQVEEMSAQTLRANAKLEEIPHEMVNALMAICDKNRIRDVQQKVEERVKSIAFDPKPNKWKEFCEELLSLLKERMNADYPSHADSVETRNKIRDLFVGELTGAQYDSLYSNIEENVVGQILKAVPSSRISFEYKDGKAYIPFETASPGQQSSAILKLLLKQEAGTLIVDQPEDDLDNNVIIQIASLLQTTKQKRQLIFATHNPNFVVNGDADKVIALRAGGASDVPEESRISVQTDGAIETPSVRSAITETMEGGQNAFELRGRKYRFGSH